MSYALAEQTMPLLDQEIEQLLAQAKAEMDARAFARARADYEAKLGGPVEAQREGGRKPRGKEPVPPDATPGPSDPFNFTDPASRIMQTKDGFQQAYNAQAAVETASRLDRGTTRHQRL